MWGTVISNRKGIQTVIELTLIGEAWQRLSCHSNTINLGKMGVHMQLVYSYSHDDLLLMQQRGICKH